MMEKLDFDRSYGVMSTLFDFSIEPFSPVFGDVERVVSYDEDGREVEKFIPVDYEKINKERGSVDMYSIDNLLTAGINPSSFNIHTGSSVSRLEGVDALQSASNDVDVLFAEFENKTE